MDTASSKVMLILMGEVNLYCVFSWITIFLFNTVQTMRRLTTLRIGLHNPLFSELILMGEIVQCSSWIMIFLFSTGACTNVHASSQSFTAIDLLFCFPSLFLEVWKVLEEQCSYFIFLLFWERLPMVDATWPTCLSGSWIKPAATLSLLYPNMILSLSVYHW